MAATNSQFQSFRQRRIRSRRTKFNVRRSTFDVFSLLTLATLLLLAAPARGADIYVSTNGAQQNTYANWTDAFTNLQAALDYAAVNAGTTVYLAGNQTFSTPTNGADAASLYALKNATNVTLSGGWQTDAAPPVTRIGGTVLKRLAASGNRRVLRMSSVSNAVIDSITIRDGYGDLGPGGTGVYLTNCASVVFSSCSIVGNSAPGTGGQKGVGMHVQQSSVVMTNCTVADNQQTGGNGSGGGGVYVAAGSSLTAIRSFLVRNKYQNAGGGGFYNDGVLNLFETVVASNSLTGGNSGGGGYNSGTLLMRNCLVVSNAAGATGGGGGLHLAGGSATIVNCTVVTNSAKGIQWAGGTVGITNCIVWGHATADLSSVPLGNVWYSSMGDGQNAGVQGCTTPVEGPRFADSTYYHLASVVSNYSGGYFSGGTWTTSLVLSALIDAGDPNSAYSSEPEPSGSRINMGYDGNMEVASLSQTLAASPPAVTNLGALHWGHQTATLRGLVTSNGFPYPQGFFRYWQVGGATTTETARAEQRAVFSASLSGLTPGQTYEHVAVASNASAEVVSDVKSFAMHPASSYLYVATNGNDTAGTNWVTAYSTVQKAMDLAEAGDAIYLAGHTFAGGISGTVPALPNNAFLIWRNATNVALRGGYDALSGGGSDPGARSGTTTVQRTVGASVRVVSMINVTNSTVELVRFTGGSGNMVGGGVGFYLTNCASVVFASCSIVGNTNVAASGKNGVGMNLQKSSIVMTNCTVADNLSQDNNAWNGVGVYVGSGSSLTAIRSFFVRNKNTSNANGGGFYNDGVLNLFETVVAANTLGGGALNGGGGVNAGTLWMRNCLVLSNAAGTTGGGGGLHLAGGTATVVNCTVVNNGAKGVQWAGGTVGMTNCIVWGHTTADLQSFPVDGVGVKTNVWYSRTGDGNGGNQGCTSADPLFVDTTYYHLQSTVSNYVNGYFTGGGWGASAGHSTLIDAGDPSPYGRELPPNGDRINMGYDGNTEVASLSQTLAAFPPAVTNLGALYWGHRTATLQGKVLDPGSPNPQGFFRYWPVGGATTETARAEQRATFSAFLTNLAPGQSYEYVAVASNSSGEVVSDVKSFATHPASSYLYVATNGNDTAGTNWVTAYTTVQKAMDLAEPGDTIYLAGHTFAGGTDPVANPHPNNAFLIWRGATNITMRGGYDAVSGGGSNPGARSGTTTVQRTAGTPVRVLSMINVTNSTVEQVRFKGGSGDVEAGGVGLYLTNCASVVFSSCSIVNNTAPGAGAKKGVGMYLQQSSVVMTNCTIADNQQTGDNAWNGGGGVYIEAGSSLTAIRSFLVRNKSDYGSGGGFFNAGALSLFETVVASNSVTSTLSGAGGYNNGTLLMRNCLVAANDCTGTGGGDGIYLGGGKATVVNCTIVTNSAVGIQWASGTVGVTNSIVWGHSTADATNFPASVSGVLSNVAYSCFGKVYGKNYGDSTAPMAGDYANSRCITNNPLFAGATTNNFRLQVTPVLSPCVNAGFNVPAWMTGAADLDGRPRIRNITVDLGAYEMILPARGFIFMVH